MTSLCANTHCNISSFKVNGRVGQSLISRCELYKNWKVTCSSYIGDTAEDSKPTIHYKAAGDLQVRTKYYVVMNIK